MGTPAPEEPAWWRWPYRSYSFDPIRSRKREIVKGAINYCLTVKEVLTAFGVTLGPADCQANGRIYFLPD